MAVLPPSDPTAVSGTRRAGLGAGLRRAVPTAVVLTGLAALGYWGHRTDWKFHAAEPGHRSVPADQSAFRIEPGPRRSDPCPDHGLPVCPLCDPAAAQSVKGHTPGAADRDRVRRALAARDRSRGEPAALGGPRVIRFDSVEAVDAAGIDIAPAWTGPVTEVVAGSGELQFDPARSTRVTARAGGTVWRVFKQVGDSVRAGEVLALVDTGEVGRAKAELQLALVQVRLRAQAARDLAGAPVNERRRTEAEVALREAEVRLLAAEQALVNLGLPPRTAELRDLAPAVVADRLHRLGLPADLGPVPGTLLPVVVPMDGVVLRAGAVAGEPADSTRVLFHVADPRDLRLVVHVPAAEAQWVRVGQDVLFRPDSGTAEASGRVTWVGVAADERTRTVPVWAAVPNPDGELRASTLGTGRVVTRHESDAVLVPASAVHMVSGTSVLFVRDRRYLEDAGPKAFHTRAVIVGARDGPNVEVIVGVAPGEVVATGGSAVLAEALRNELAGVGSRDE